MKRRPESPRTILTMLMIREAHIAAPIPAIWNPGTSKDVIFNRKALIISSMMPSDKTTNGNANATNTGFTSVLRMPRIRAAASRLGQST